MHSIHSSVNLIRTTGKQNTQCVNLLGPTMWGKYKVRHFVKNVYKNKMNVALQEKEKLEGKSFKIHMFLYQLLHQSESKVTFLPLEVAGSVWLFSYKGSISRWMPPNAVMFWCCVCSDTLLTCSEHGDWGKIAQQHAANTEFVEIECCLTSLFFRAECNICINIICSNTRWQTKFGRPQHSHPLFTSKEHMLLNMQPERMAFTTLFRFSYLNIY